MREDNVSVDGDVPALRLFRHRKIRTACEKEGPEGPCRTEKKIFNHISDSGYGSENGFGTSVQAPAP